MSSTGWAARVCAGTGALILAASLIPGTSVAAAAGPSTFDATTTQALDAIAQAEMTAGNVPGMAIGVWVGNRRYVHTFGTADLASASPFQPGDHVRIASITKTFVGTEVLRLVDRGALHLDDRLSRYVDQIPNGAQITIRQLLNMTAGVYDFTKDDAITTAFDQNPQMPFGADQVLQSVRSHQPDFAPGQGWSYSDSNYILLGLAIEKVTGRSLPQVITSDVLKPLKLKASSYPTTPTIPSPFARGYLPPAGGESRRDVTAINPTFAGAAGAMISNLPDLRVWAQGLADGALLKTSTQRQRLNGVPTGLSPALDVRYGLGVFEVQGFVGHNGAIYGYNSAAFSLPHSSTTIVVVANSSTNFEGVGLDAFVKIAKLVAPGRFPATTTTSSG